MAVIKTTTATVTTTSTTATTLWTISSTDVSVWAKIHKRRGGLTDRNVQTFFVQALHYTSTEASQVTSETSIATTGAGGTVAFVTNGSNNIELQVTAGSTDSTIWVAEISYIDENA